ncbi:MAG: ferrous iron transport protein B [Turicibacter sp.]|nr:ferrous iron transport protein B [Turicibacter sp.]
MELLLIGNPNVGKTTLFNQMTGMNAQVANWSGATVEGLPAKLIGSDVTVIDLPGTYSLTPSGADEGVVAEAMLAGGFDGIINIVDASRLRRNLHLSIQLLEAGKPMAIALNMMDELSSRGLKLDVEKFQECLGIEAIPVDARKKMGTQGLLAKASCLSPVTDWKLYYGKILEGAIMDITRILPKTPENKRWLAIQVLENNPCALDLFPHLREAFAGIVERTQGQVVKSGEALSLKGAIFNKRRAYITEVCSHSLSRTGLPKTGQKTVDHVLTHPIWGLAFFFAVMFLAYTLTFDLVGNPLSQMFERAINEGIVPWVRQGMAQAGIVPGTLASEGISQGILTGVGGVIVFLPQILILFFCLSLMEGTGYMARVALVMDDAFSHFGLNGKSIVPLITGFGCNVPAMMATRTIKDRAERMKTIAIIPFMSCSARLPVYVLFVGLFFPNHQALVIMGLYLLGMAVALGGAKLLSVTAFNRPQEPFVLEIPPYRMPQLGLVFRQTMQKGQDFLQSAGKFIILGSVLMWFLQYVGPNGVGVPNHESYLAHVGGFIAPLFAPLGLGSWEIASSLVVGFFAKELLASSMIVIAGSETAIAGMLTQAQAFGFLVFSLLYLPCLATIGIMHKESKSVVTTFKMLAFGFGAAYLVGFLAFHLFQFFS